MEFPEELIEEIKKDKDMLLVYKALLLLEKSNANTLLQEMALENMILNHMGYHIDYDTHTIRKDGKRY